MEIEKEREMVPEIKRWFHEHPLAWVEVGEQSNQSEKNYCSGCGDLVLGACFSCGQCKYHLHKKCAEAPYEIEFHPLHRKHSDFFLVDSPLKEDRIACGLCKEKRNMFFYVCYNCDFALDIKCALFLYNFGENFNEFKDDAFQNQFMFLENHKDELKKLNCSSCHESLVDSIYVSSECKIYLHKKCFESLVFEIDHPCHRIHTLILQFFKENRFCKLCQKEDDYNLFYHCFACKFDFHHECVWPQPIIEVKRYHEHPFTLFWRQEPSICNACGIEGNNVSYQCSTCHLQLHKKCTSLPHIIEVSRHVHILFHKYFLKKRDLEKLECQICFDEVKTEYGSYRCSKEDCNYIVHVNCAREDDTLYYTINQENQVVELDEQTEAMDSSITCVIKDGKATEIKHFIHEHNLLLEDKIEEDTDRNCDGCMLSISIPFYYCSECNFFLHKTCAEIPKIKDHRLHRFNGTLEFREFLKCALCKRFCSGLFYESKRDFYFCLRCAKVPNIIKREGHKHFLFFDHKCRGKCNACGVDMGSGGAFSCKKCTFALDFACMTLPLAIQHKSDDHLLKLEYDGENDDIKQPYCDICEEERDPSLWYYYCSTCDNSAHPECVLGKYPFVKDGVTWPLLGHQHVHNLIFVQKVDGYPKCNECDKLCQDQTLKCSECIYFLHSKCLDSRYLGLEGRDILRKFIN